MYIFMGIYLTIITKGKRLHFYVALGHTLGYSYIHDSFLKGTCPHRQPGGPTRELQPDLPIDSAPQPSLSPAGLLKLPSGSGSDSVKEVPVLETVPPKKGHYC